MATISKDEYQRVQNAVNNAYTADSIKNYTNAYNQYMAQGMSSNDAYSKASSLLVKNGATTNAGTTPTKTTTTPTYTTTPTQNTTPTRTATSTPTNTQTTQSQSTTSTSSPISDNGATRQYWDNLSYEQQQEKLKQVSWLKEALNKRWWAIKTPDWQTTQQTTQTSNVSNDWWDYQDNSPERMMQMANNLEQMYQTDPWLFANEQTFKNFFINWKGRTPEQEQFLLDYYKNRKIYNEYDWLTSAKVWSMAANWQVPESYLNYLKNSNPQRYQEVMAGKEQEENRIKDNSSYSDLLTQAGFEDTANTAWQKKEWLLVDENNDLIDDRLYHEPTAEEREKVDRINEIDSEVLDIENTYKHTYDDLVKKYPWATKATLMAMAQDRCSDLLRRKEDLMVERTKLAWTVEYLQSERQAQDDAGKQTIANLQKNLWMYYEYSPEWMSDRIQAQYAATNVTLEQAENWTDTQKQMALENVLDGYYDKYWAIIQRSEQQVIWDIMKYAKDNWVSLSQALEENFLKPLRSKPWFNQLSTITSNPDVVRIGTDANGNPIYWTYNSATGQFNPISLSSLWLWGDYSYGWTGWTTTTPWWVKYTTVSEDAKVWWLSDFLSWFNVWDYAWRCWAFVNDYLEKIWAWHIYDNDLSTKLNSINVEPSKWEMPSVWDVAVFDFSKAPANSSISADARKYGHVAIVVWVDDQKWTVTIVESNKDWDKTVWKPREVPISNAYLKWYFNPSKWYNWSAWNGGNNFGGKFSWSNDWNNNGYFNSLARDLQWYIENWKLNIPNDQYKSLKQTYGINDQEFRQMAANYANAELKTSGWSQASEALKYAVKVYELLYGNQSGNFTTNWLARSTGQIVPWTDQEKAKNEYNSLMKRLTLKELFDAKALGATFGAMSDSEWSLLQNAATDLNWYNSNFKENLSELIESLYDAAVDWKAALPSNFAWSWAEQMIKTIKAEWSWIGWGKFNQNWSTNDIYSDLYD